MPSATSFAQLRAAGRRLVLIFGVIAGGTAALGALVSVAAGTGMRRSLSVSFYIAGAALLVGSFIMGARGPLRPEWRDDQSLSRFLAPRGLRRANDDEISSSHRSSLLLFGLGLALIGIGVGLDPRT